MREIFGSIAAQADNLGDIAIRRVAVIGFIDAGYKPILFTGAMPQEYIAAFDFPESVKLVSSSLRYQLLLVEGLASRRADLLFAPGPTVLKDSVPHLLKSLMLLTVIGIIRLAGGRVYSLGRAIRGHGRLSRRLELVRKRLSAVYTVRDDSSRRYLGADVDFVPDLAFAIPATTIDHGDREFVSISLRSDRPVSPHRIGEFIDRIREAGRHPLFVSQVRRDDDQHEELATYFKCESVLWGDRSHTDQYQRVLAAYSSSHALLSNRLHGILFGVSQNAFPVEWFDGSNKIGTTLSSLLPQLTRFDISEQAAAADGFEFLEMSNVERQHLGQSYAAAGARVRSFLASSI